MIKKTFASHPKSKFWSNVNKVEWCKIKRHCPFDFAIPSLKLVIELDGPQHFKQVSNWEPPEQTQHRDAFKTKCANENGWKIIRLLQVDVFNDENKWGV
jgi:very-short-patch-repair endonuclease